MQDLIQKTESGFLGIFFAQVYAWMTLGIFLTSIIAFGVMLYVEYSPQTSLILIPLLPFVFLVEIGLVVALSWLGLRFNTFLNIALFLIYSALNGLFFGMITIAYEINSIVIAFIATTLVFGAMALYGALTKRDLSGIGSIAFFGLFALIIGTFLNILISILNPSLGGGFFWILTYVGLGIFLILVAVDNQKIKKIGEMAQNESQNITKYSIRGALTLYLDFINIFIRILAITGRRR